MMMKKTPSKKPILIALGILLFLAAACFLGYIIIDRVGENKRAAAAPPTVQLISPTAGDTYPVGQMINVLASAIGTVDIQVLELRLDGQSTEKAFNDGGIDGAFDGHFEITLTEGPHTLSVRATDQNGLIGQSMPITIIGSADKPEDGLLMYVSQEGDTLASIADEFGIDLDKLKELNPDLGDGVIPPGTRVTLPPDRDEEPPQEPAPAPAAGADGQATQPGTQNQPGGPPPNTSPLIEVSEALPIVDWASIITTINTPKAPSGLSASHEGCLVTLSWNDNSTNEDAFRIWFSGLGVPPRVIATVSSSEHTGPVWYQFNTPPAGIYSFWVEAVNSLAAQPSEDVWIGVPATQCEDFTAPYLYFSVNRLEIIGNYDEVYCYVSVEGAPEHRFPKDDFLFYETGILPGETHTEVFWGGIESFVVPYPEDGKIDIEGECLAWSGGSLNSLGTFDAAMVSGGTEFRDTQFIETPNFTIWMIVRPYGYETPEGTYTFFDPDVQIPHNLQITDTGFSAIPNYPSDKEFSWDWQGDESEILGFFVTLNGNSIGFVSKDRRSVIFPAPARCGMHVELEIAVLFNSGILGPSETITFDLPPCQMRAEVIFYAISTGRTRDSLRGKCDQIETYFEQFVWSTGEYKRNLGVGSGYSWRFPMTCGKTYKFDDIGYALTKKRGLDRFEVEINPMNPELEIGLFGWDYDWGSANDPLIMAREKITDLPVDNWQGYYKEIELSGFFDSSSSALVVIRAIP